MVQKKKELIKELLLNSRRSDRDLAKSLGLTQPTVGRLRKGLEKEGSILGYTAVPDFPKIGVGIMAFTFFEWTRYKETEKLKKFEEFLVKNDSVFFSAPGEGFDGRTKALITLHEDYAGLERFLRLFRSEWAEMVDKMDTFVVSSKNIIKNFDFQGIARSVDKG